MKELTQEQKNELFPKNCILMAYRGSVAHGMYVPNTDPNSIDDIDLMGVYLAPKRYYIGRGAPIECDSNGNKIVDHRRSYERFIGEYDVVSYELRKFVNAVLKSNPNMLGMLWLRDEHYVLVSQTVKRLLDNRDLFMSKLAYNAFTNYAATQLKKMTQFTTEGYMGQKRKALVEKYGYDCKNAAHCIRLLRMGTEFLQTGKLNVYREHDGDELLDIKRGKWTLEQVKEEANNLFVTAEQAYKDTDLPETPDFEKVEILLMDILSEYIYDY